MNCGNVVQSIIRVRSLSLQAPSTRYPPSYGVPPSSIPPLGVSIHFRRACSPPSHFGPLVLDLSDVPFRSDTAVTTANTAQIAMNARVLEPLGRACGSFGGGFCVGVGSEIVCGVGAGASVDWQCLHLTAATLIVSAQKGQDFVPISAAGFS